MIAYTTKRRAKRLLKIEFIRFCIVGGTGFVINLVLLTLFRKFFGLPVFFAQLIGAEIALFSNFLLHHYWTYKNRHVQKSLITLLLQFHATTWPAIIGSALMVHAGERLLHLNDLLALTISSTVALAWNFVWSKFVIWKSVSPKEIEEIAT